MYNKCFQYSTTLSLFHLKINCHLERITKIKYYMNNFNWENINFPPTQQDYEQFEMNNNTIALNILKIQEQEKISHHYKSRYNKTRKNKTVLLMITDNDKEHYIFVKTLDALLKNKNNHNACYFCISCLKRFTAKLGLKKHYQKSC